MYFLLGLEHILNWAALDHLLFILSLTCIYTYLDYKKILWLVTAFTLGHSITLALATLQVIQVNMKWVEFLIPCTILISAIANLIKIKKEYKISSSFISKFQNLSSFNSKRSSVIICSP